MSNLQNAHALLIGIGNDLPVTVHDATAIHNILADQSIAGYNPDNIILLTDKEATRDGILEAFDLLISKIDEESSVFLFYSGHGGLYEPWNQFYLVPNNFDAEEYETTWVKAEELKEKISAINSKKLVFFLDCCHAAGMTKSAPKINSPKNQEKIRLENADGLAQKLDDGKGMSIISSCREDQLSYIMDGDNNSLFTKCLIEVLKGKHKSHFNEPYVRISEVIQYVFKSVPQRNPEQKPYANLQIYDDFALSYIPENKRNTTQPVVVPVKTEEHKDTTVTTVYRKSEASENALIFVHGFSGEAANSFGEVPNFIMQDSTFDDWDLFPIGFSEFVKPTFGKNIWASIDDIEKIADYLTTSIKYKFGSYKNIAIIAHGLGGIVTQKAIINLDIKHIKRISHLLLFASPNNGITSNFISKLWNKHLKEFNEKSSFITNLRLKWDALFNDGFPFTFKVIAATHDEYISPASNLVAFPKEYRETIVGNHFSIIQPKNKEAVSYQLIVNTLSNSSQLNKEAESEEIHLVLEDYKEVVDNLLPNVNDLGKRGLERLIFALEKLDRRKEAFTILENHPLSKNNSDVLGLIGGRYKRKYLISYIKSEGEDAIKYYSKGLELAINDNNFQQIYYLNINLAFLSLIVKDDIVKMKAHAKNALLSCEKDSYDSLWKLATIAEANMYLGNIKRAQEFYLKASKIAAVREKISIYNNAYTGYLGLIKSNNPQDEFIKFLKASFLN